MNEKFLSDIYKKCNVKDYKDIIILTLDCLGNVYVQTKEEKPQTFCVKMRGAKW